MDSSGKDPYDILGISRGANSTRIRKVYWCLAKKYHPDKNPGDREAEEKFRQVQRAYEKLTSRDIENMPSSEGLEPKQPATPFSGDGDPFFSFFEGLKAYYSQIKQKEQISEEDEK